MWKLSVALLSVYAAASPLRRQLPPSVASASAAATQFSPKFQPDYPFSCAGDLYLTYLIQQTTYQQELPALLDAVGNWTNATFIGLASANGTGTEVGDTRSLVVNGEVTLMEMLLNYTVDSSTGAVTQDWNLTNGPVTFASDIIVSNYTFELQAYTNNTAGGSTLKMFVNLCTNNQQAAQADFAGFVSNAQDNVGDLLNGLPLSVSSFSTGAQPSSASGASSALSGATMSASLSGSPSGISSALSGSGILPVPIPTSGASATSGNSASSIIASATSAALSEISSAISSASAAIGGPLSSGAAASSVVSIASSAASSAISVSNSVVSAASSGSGTGILPIPIGGSNSASSIIASATSAALSEISSAISSASEAVGGSLSSGAAASSVVSIASSAASSASSVSNSVLSSTNSGSSGTGVLPVPIGGSSGSDSLASATSASSGATSAASLSASDASASNASGTSGTGIIPVPTGASSGSSESGSATNGGVASASMSGSASGSAYSGSAGPGSLSLSSTGTLPSMGVESGPLFIDQPATFEQCQGSAVNFGGGQPPYFIKIIPGNQPYASPYVNFPLQSVPGSYTYDVDLPAGTNISLYVMDGRGTENYTMPFFVGSSDNSTCLNDN